MSVVVTIRLSDNEIRTLIGSASKLYEFTQEELENALLDSIIENPVNTWTALLSLGIIVREHFMELIMQIDKDKLDPDAAMLLASIKAKHKLEKSDGNKDQEP